MAVHPPVRRLADVPAAHAAAREHAVALHFEGRDIACAHFAATCDAAAGTLWHGWNVRPGDRLAWLGANHPGQLALLFALARIGAILLPLNVRLAAAELQAQLTECAPVHLVHDDAMAALAREVCAQTGVAAHHVDALIAEGTSAGELPAVDVDADSPVLLVYTSGTTSRPKAAMHTQANLLANMRIASAVQRITPEDVVATVLPLFHVGGLCIQTLPALYAGATVILHPRFNADATFDCFERQRPTLTLQVPATMKALADHPRWTVTDLSSLRAVWAGSSLLPGPLIEAFHARGVPVCNVYGATETGPFSIALPPERAFDHAGSCGWPAPEVEVRIAGEQGDSGDVHKAGELLIRAPNVVARYWLDVPACDAQGWFHTGDLASCAADGSYTIRGRAKDLIISGGENIHPAEIESVLAEHVAVAECAAFGVHDDAWGETVAVAVVLKAGATASEQDLHTHLAQRIARFKLPRRWFWLEALPKTALGKVQRHVLAKLAGIAPSPAGRGPG
jgi:fatty-acyl-CoA synthase